MPSTSRRESQNSATHSPRKRALRTACCANVAEMPWSHTVRFFCFLLSRFSLAPPPSKAIVPVADLVSPVVGDAVPAAVVVPFSFLRWLSTSRSAWSWVVRALGVAGAVGIVFGCIKVYEAWLRDMQRRHEAREASFRARRERDAATNQATTITNAAAEAGEADIKAKRDGASAQIIATTAAGAEATPTSGIPAAVAYTSSSDGAKNFQLLSTLLCTRYASLQRYASVLKHVQFPAAGASTSSSSASVSVATAPVTLNDASKLKLVFDELDSALQENVYLKDLLRRINGQLAKG